MNSKTLPGGLANIRLSFNYYCSKFNFCRSNVSFNVFNPIPAGVLENQDMLGVGPFDPPSKSHALCPNMTNDTSLESSCALLLESAKKFANLQKLNFLSQNPII